jgi:single-stranded-DNA-specific exonuclease
VDLFLTEDKEHARNIVEKLIEINTERQATEGNILEEAYRKITEEHDFENDHVIVLDGDNWHQGVIGIVASRITEKYNLPSILVSFEDGVGKGSGRSVHGMNLVDALRDSQDLLMKFGGHALAAGLSIERDKLDEFKKRINLYAKTHVSEEDAEVCLEIDCEVFPKEFNISLAEELLCLEPYGVSNPVPLFVMRNVKVSDMCGIGQNKHTRLTLSSADGVRITALCFGTPPEAINSVNGELIDVVFNININEFQNQKSVQMVVKDMAFTSDAMSSKQRHNRLIEKIKSGEFLTQRECISYIPCREDYVLLYRFIRKEINAGRDIFSDHYFSTQHIGHPEKLNMTKIRMILKIFGEAGIIKAERLPSQFSLGSSYRFTLGETDKKFSLESSELYRDLSKYRN